MKITKEAALQSNIFWFRQSPAGHSLLAIRSKKSPSGWITVKVFEYSLWERNLHHFAKEYTYYTIEYSSDFNVAILQEYEKNGYEIPWHLLGITTVSKYVLRVKMI